MYRPQAELHILLL